PPASPEATARAIQASSSPRPAQSSPLPEPALENETFVTLDGISRYKIGPGDVLELLLTKGFTQEKHTAIVQSDGTVTVTFFNAKVMGLTTYQAAEEIHRILSPYYKQLSIEVLVKEYNSKKVAIFGAVKGNPGVYPLKGRTTLLDLLAAAGGPAPTANLDAVRLIRPGDISYTVNLNLLLANGTPARDVEIVLDTRDVVFVPSVEDKKVFALGEVKKPGVFPMVPNMRLSQLMAQAGGAKFTAVLESARVIRGNLNSPEIIAVDFRSLLEEGDVSQDIRLEVNDVVFLPRSAVGDWNVFMEKIKPTLVNVNLLLRNVVDSLIIQDFFAD
ncbi:MAG: SLBB domain-containing protein, partial [Nitrospinota bacterium]